MGARAALLLLFLSSLSGFFIACLLVFSANFLHRSLVAVVLLSLVLFTVILIIVIVNLLQVWLAFELLLAVKRNMLLAVSFLFVLGVLPIFIFVTVSFLLTLLFPLFTTIVVDLAFLDHALQVLKDHLAGQEASNKRLYLDNAYQSLLIDIGHIFIIIVFMFVLVASLAVVHAR